MPPKTYKRKTYKKKGSMTTRQVQKVVQRALDKNIETKQGIRQLGADGTEILHNNFIVMTNTPLQTIQGDGDQMPVKDKE